MKLEYRDGLLFTSIMVRITVSQKIDNIVVDTELYCIIEPNAISLGITSSKHDK